MTKTAAEYRDEKRQQKHQNNRGLYVQLAAGFVGLLITAGIYVFFDSQIKNIKVEDAAQIRAEAQTELQRNFDELQHTLRSVHRLVEISGDESEAYLAAQVQLALPLKKHFENIYWIKPKWDGSWMYVILDRIDEQEPDFLQQFDEATRKKMEKDIIERKPEQAKITKILNIDGVQTTQFNDYDQAYGPNMLITNRTIAFVRTIIVTRNAAKGPETSVLVAFARPGRFYNESWLRSQELIKRLSVYANDNVFRKVYFMDREHKEGEIPVYSFDNIENDNFLPIGSNTLSDETKEFRLFLELEKENSVAIFRLLHVLVTAMSLALTTLVVVLLGRKSQNG